MDERSKIINNVYSKYYKWAMNHLRKKAFSEEDAEDIIQNTLLSMANNKDLRSEGSIALFTKSIELTSISSRSRNPMSNFSRQFFVVGFKNPENELISKENMFHLDRALLKLPPKESEGIVRRLDEVKLKREVAPPNRYATLAINRLKKDKSLKNNACVLTLPEDFVIESSEFNYQEKEA